MLTNITNQNTRTAGTKKKLLSIGLIFILIGVLSSKPLAQIKVKEAGPSNVSSFGAPVTPPSGEGGDGTPEEEGGPEVPIGNKAHLLLLSGVILAWRFLLKKEEQRLQTE
ncbi:hypothetical protein FUAX_37960 [Fulvitalea axinellae]|uniref:LPXTG cell wall anchor domain-containing protein n=1 Tax=Fulvitalea axinellae TaxID=1182444 RepID=A0AAU9CXV1_9BACT|nr:hypothetical protein FUAX_37960 [Fulvitalea axinellae]